jgi:hypothetical protein
MHAEPAMATDIETSLMGTRVTFRPRELFDDPFQLLSNKREISRLARVAEISIRTLREMIKSEPGDGFMSDPILRLCAELGKQPARVIIGRKVAQRDKQRIKADPADDDHHALAEVGPRYSAATLPPKAGLAPDAAAPPREFTVDVPGDRSMHDLIDPKATIGLRPGETMEFVDFDKHAQWSHNPMGGFRLALLKHPRHFPDNWDMRRIASAADIEAACRELDILHEFAVRNIIVSYALPKLRELLEVKGALVDWLIGESQRVLRSAGLKLPPEVSQIGPHVERLKCDLRQNRRPVKIEFSDVDAPHCRAALALWERAEFRVHLEDFRRGKLGVQRLFSMLLPQGHSTPTSPKHYPLPSAPAGSCVCVCGVFRECDGFVPRRIENFFDRGHQVHNDSKAMLHCLLICNDDRPGDNLGRVNITCRIL